MFAFATNIPQLVTENAQESEHVQTQCHTVLVRESVREEVLQYIDHVHKHGSNGSQLAGSCADAHQKAIARLNTQVTTWSSCPSSIVLLQKRMCNNIPTLGKFIRDSCKARALG
jgi:hypothetical protein